MTGTARIAIPRRINAKFAKHNNLPTQDAYQYYIPGLILQRAKTSEEEFKRCWLYLHPVLTDDELFSLFKDSGFSPRAKYGRLEFVRSVLKKYKDAKVLFLSLRVFLSLAFGLFTDVFACARGADTCLHDSSIHLYDQENVVGHVLLTAMSLIHACP